MSSQEVALIVSSLVKVCPWFWRRLKKDAAFYLNKCKMPSPKEALIVPSLVKIGPAVLEKRKI